MSFSVSGLMGKSPRDVAAALADRPEIEQRDALEALMGAGEAGARVARAVVAELDLAPAGLTARAAVPAYAGQARASVGEARANAGQGKVAARLWASPAEAPALDGATMRELAALGVPRGDFGRFAAGEAVLFHLPTRTGDDTEGFVQDRGDHLSAGIISVHAEGEGKRALFDFRAKARALARARGHRELELVGGAVINDKLEQMLGRLGFEPGVRDIPEAYGGGTMDVLVKRFEVK